MSLKHLSKLVDCILSAHLDHEMFSCCRVWQGHNWAKPNQQHLQYLMKFAYEHPHENAERGIRAREHMLANYSIEKYASILKAWLQSVSQSIPLIFQGKRSFQEL
jgi:hypothetical protein